MTEGNGSADLSVPQTSRPAVLPSRIPGEAEIVPALASLLLPCHVLSAAEICLGQEPLSVVSPHSCSSQQESIIFVLKSTYMDF